MSSRSEYTANIELANKTAPVAAVRVNIASGNNRAKVAKPARKQPGFLARMLGA